MDPVVTTQHLRPFPAQVGQLSENAKAPATPALGQDGEAGHINKEMEAPLLKFKPSAEVDAY